MFKRSADRVAKARKSSKRSFRDAFRDEAKSKLRDQLTSSSDAPSDASSPPAPTGGIVTIVAGVDQRMFAAHEDVLSRSPFFAAACRDVLAGSNHRRIALVDEEPEVLSAVLEYLYKGDYTPRLLHDKKRNSWILEDGSDMPSVAKNPASHYQASSNATVYSQSIGDTVLRETAIYCSAERYGLEELKRLALRKQSLLTGIDVATILRSARYAYDNTPETDSRLRAWYLAMIVRNRKSFKRSATMQTEMEAGGKMFFDLFVAMCNHVDDILDTNVSMGSSVNTV